MTLSVPLSPEMEAKLRELAAAEGKDPAAVALEALAEKLSAPNGALSQAAADTRIAALNRFFARARQQTQKLPFGHTADDSRDSIYDVRGK